MKAIVYTKYGSPDVLQLKDIEKPTPNKNEALIKVHAASLNVEDLDFLRGRAWSARFLGPLKPKYKVLGFDIAGRVEAVGTNVKQFHLGDEVFGDLFNYGFGAFAEFVCAPEEALALKPVSLSFEEAATIPSRAIIALQGLRNKRRIQSGQKVLINGAGGGVGPFAIQIAKYFGAEVTGVDNSKKLGMLRSIGADHVIDYTQEDFTKNGMQYDLILATNGYHPLADYQQALSTTGRYVMTGGANAQMTEAMLYGPLKSRNGKQQMGNLLAQPNQKDLEYVAELLAAGKVKPVIAKRYPLAETADAIRDMEAGRAQGKIIITM